MKAEVVFEKLNELFRQPHVLPQLHESAMRLVNAIDGGEASNTDLARMISSDPTLAANVLRVASSAAYATTEARPTTVPGAVMRLGHKAVRSLAVAIIVQSLVSRAAKGTSFQHQRFARHSTFVALMGQHLFARRQNTSKVESQWTPEEVFAAGILHDVSIALLAKVAPKVHDTVCSYARRGGETFESTFERLFGKPLATLGFCAAETWELPEVFILTLKARIDPSCLDATPWFRDCLVFADQLATQQGFAYEDWPLQKETLSDADAALFISPDDLMQLVRTIHRESCLWLGDSAKMAS